MTNESITSTPSFLSGTVGFTRKMQPAQYEGAEASIYLQFDYQPDSSVDEIVAKATDAFAQAKGLVFEQLGITFSVEEGGRVMETLRQAFPAAQVQAAPRAAAPAPTGTAPTSGGFAGTCPGCGGTEFFDNTAKKASGEFKSNAPDAKCKNRACGKGIWSK